MKNKIKKFLLSLTSVLLTFVMLFLTSCSLIPNIDNPPVSDDEPGDEGDTGTIPVIPSDPDDTEFEDYGFNEAENFIYGLIFSDLTKQYETFTGYITLESNEANSEQTEVYGISYVDYEEGYIDESGKVYFSAGFISFPDEHVITKDDISSGLEIVSLEEEYTEQFSYVYSYNTEDVHMHCVIDNKYVKYDVIDGTLHYSEEPYVEGMIVDPTRGNIYNYDIEDYVYIIEEQSYIPVSGVSLVGEADYQEVMNEVNRILQTQDANLTYAEVESYVYHSQEAFYSYLLGLQEESFMGIPTAELIDCVRDLDPMQHLKIGVDENGATSIEIIEVTKLPSRTEKIVTSVICGFGVVLGVVCNVLGTVFPVTKMILGPIGGALIGASMEAFTQVVINNTPTSDIQWAQIGVAAASGAIAGAIGIQIQGVGNVLLREVADTLCDSLIGGTEFFVNSLIGGLSFEEACKNFGYGVIAGAVISGGVKIGSAALKGGAKLIKKATTSTISDVGGKQLTKLGNEVAEDGLSELQEKAIGKNSQTYINEVKKTITNTSDIPMPSSRTIITSNTKKHILEGCFNAEGNWRGGHSPKILSDPSYVIASKRINADGSIMVWYSKKMPDGSITNSKMSTLFPESWSDKKILKSIREITTSEHLDGYRIEADGTFSYLYVGVYEGVEIQVIKAGNNVITACPIGSGKKFSFNPIK